MARAPTANPPSSSVLRGIFGDYATSAPIETFVAGFGERHPTDLAGLAGARLVTVLETEEGRRWTESKIKAITGGDPIKARFMHRDFFEFIAALQAPRHRQPQAADPLLRRGDAATCPTCSVRVTIPPERRQPDLAARSPADERDGILAWAVAGLVEWRRIGLAPPPAVTQATIQYFEEEDALGDWLRGMHGCRSRCRYQDERLYASWKAWADAAGEFVQTQNRLAREMLRRGFRATRNKQFRGFAGIRLGRIRSEPAGDPA